MSVASNNDIKFNLNESLKTCNSGFNVIHVNACSLYKKLDYFRYIIDNLPISAICISETWLTSDHTWQMVCINGFKMFRNDRNRGGKTGGGVAIYIRHNLPSKMLCKSKPNEKLEFIMLEVKSNYDKILLSTVYNPPNSREFDKFNEALDLYCDQYMDIILTGDFNTNILRQDINTYNFIHMFQYLNLSILNDAPTHIVPKKRDQAGSSQSCLDLFIVSDLAKVIKFTQMPISKLSHHDLILLSFKADMSYANETGIEYRNYKNVNLRSLLEDCYTRDWAPIYSSSDINQQMDFFIATLQDLTIKHVPLSRSKPKIAYTPYNFELNLANVNRDLAHKQWRRSGRKEDWDRYTNLKANATTLENKAWQEHFKTVFNESQSSKQLWKNIDKLGLKSVPSQSVLFKSEDLNKHFTSIPTVTVGHTAIDDLRTGQFSQSNVSEEEVHRAIISIKSKAVGDDEISPKMIIILLPHILHHITYLFNTVLTTSKYPNCWKRAKVLPLPKVSEPNSCSDYRPISILPFLSKAFERLLHNQISSYLTINNLLANEQSGFRSKRSTETSLVNITEDIRAGIDKKHVNMLVLLDFSKAFDNVDHRILINKLQNLCFDRTSCQLVYSYLTERSQYVTQLNDTSNPSPLHKGVPQGSVLGPLLFSLFINDLPGKVTFSNCHMFADDVQLHASGLVSNIDNIFANLNLDLAAINRWALNNKLVLNPKKSTCIAITRCTLANIVFPELYLGNEIISRSSSAKNLGVYFDSKLSWAVHVRHICSYVRGALRRLWMIAWALPTDTKLRLIRSLVVPYFTYGCRVFSSISKELHKKLNMAINACTRFVYGLRKFDRLGNKRNAILKCSLQDLYNNYCCLLLAKIIKTREPKYLYDRLQFAQSDRTRNLIPPARRLSSLDDLFFIKGVTLWNALPARLKNLETYTSFKTQLKKFNISLSHP